MEPTTTVLKADTAAIAAAARCLDAGGLVAFPTETVYGLGADACNALAVARLYAAKGRPSFNPLIAHVPDLAAARGLARFDAAAERLAAALWPGPLTLVLPKYADCPVAELATAGLDTIAVRVPADPTAQAIIRALGRPVVAPSANRSGHVSATAAHHVLADLGGRIDLIVDGGSTPLGVESTIVACIDAPLLLRPGGIPRAAIAAALDEALREQSPPVEAVEGEAPLAPGQLESHYAPAARLRLNATDVQPGERLLAFGPALSPGAERAGSILNLSDRADLFEAAANLFSYLRKLDAGAGGIIAVMPIPEHGLGEAINDRLRRAAAPRG